MKTSSVFSFIAAFILLLSSVYAQTTKDYLNVKGPLGFDQASYNLSWTSHPSDNFYKQEYLVKGDNPERFKSMIVLDLLTEDLKVEDVVSKKIAELKALKESNPYVNYNLYEKDGEVILDFLISANAADGKTIQILERNIYRYKKIEYATGQRGILLFGISVRSYDEEVGDFLTNLKTNKSDLINKIAKFTIPKITIQ